MAKLRKKSEACGGCEKPDQASRASANPDHSTSVKRVNRIKGQLEAVSRMIDERQYCPEIIQQIRAAASALRSLETEIFRGHLQACVKKAFRSKDPFEANTKIDEVLRLISR